MEIAINIHYCSNQAGLQLGVKEGTMRLAWLVSSISGVNCKLGFSPATPMAQPAVAILSQGSNANVKIEPDDNLQDVVDRFIEGPARIKRSVNLNKGEEATENNESVIYKDVSMERVSFLVQQAIRAFHAQNLGNAKSRLNLCAEDIRS
ncbi:hypothetical protein KIW84_021260 [Lathyrus oleraceus]|uniref:Uncharacterized protein n=1 Tax=Pisum sativum TaxID=3888 RepID=A0A9D5B3Q1_PEA|nr:hypothetical protein KIW84_021260 [Pisum sativum]